LVGHLLIGRHGRRQHVGHLGPALERRRRGRLVAARPYAWEQVSQRAQQHAGLRQRRQYLRDVAQERRVPPDDEYAPRLQLLPVRVEQVGGAVQRDGGLAGAGSTLDDQYAGGVRPDDAVLLGLDRGDDVLHTPGPARRERTEQG